MKLIIKITAYILGFLGVYFIYNEIEYFMLMNQLLIALSIGLLFYVDKIKDN